MHEHNIDIVDASKYRGVNISQWQLSINKKKKKKVNLKKKKKKK
jgi:hypothetical protein